MKRILGLIVLIFCFYGVSGQESSLQADMEFLGKKLQIKESQRASLSKILIKKHNTMQDLLAMRSSNEDLFRQKRRNIISGTEASIKMILAEEQLKLWHAYKSEMRIANAERSAALKARNASKQDLLDAHYGIEN